MKFLVLKSFEYFFNGNPYIILSYLQLIRSLSSKFPRFHIADNCVLENFYANPKKFLQIIMCWKFQTIQLYLKSFQNSSIQLLLFVSLFYSIGEFRTFLYNFVNEKTIQCSQSQTRVNTIFCPFEYVTDKPFIQKTPIDDFLFTISEILNIIS